MNEGTPGNSLINATPLLDHLQDLAKRMRRIIFTILLFTAFFLFFGPSSIAIKPFAFGIPFLGNFTIRRLPVIVPSFINSFSTVMIRYFIYHEIPKGMVVLNVNVFDPILSSMQVSLLFSIIVSMPVILIELWKFVSPALYQSEKTHIKWTIIPAILLFLAGASFAYFIVIPVLLLVVKLYIVSLGIQETLSFKSVITIIVGFLFAFGLSFELPVIMVTLTKFGFVGSKFWLENWRMGVLGSFIIALIISPGVTGGLIETIIGLTLSGLYIAGALVARKVENASAEKKQFFFDSRS